jgi:hypothetical protein
MSTKGAFGRQKKSGPRTIPYSITEDIAKLVRSIDWRDYAPTGGLCFPRIASGLFVLTAMGMKTTPVLGGMVYRAGPDPERDAVAFCGACTLGCRKHDGGILAHYWLRCGNDFVDFSVGDWHADASGINDYYPPDSLTMQLGPIVWTAPALPEFFWNDSRMVVLEGPSGLREMRKNDFTPDLGIAWYTGWNGFPPDIWKMVAELMPILKPRMAPHMGEIKNLRERLGSRL